MFEELQNDWHVHKSVQGRNVMVKYAATGRKLTILGMMLFYITVIFMFCPMYFGIPTRTITNLTDKPGRIVII